MSEKRKRCAWCSTQAYQDVFHDESEFGNSIEMWDGLKSSCKYSMMIRKKQRNTRENGVTPAVQDALANAKFNTPAWFHSFHKYDYGYFDNPDLWYRQMVLTQPWRKDRVRAERLAA